MTSALDCDLWMRVLPFSKRIPKSVVGNPSKLITWANQMLQDEPTHAPNQGRHVCTTLNLELLLVQVLSSRKMKIYNSVCVIHDPFRT